jgi:acetylornithine/N-succinyldiaminopimelate aminotransferase
MTTHLMTTYAPLDVAFTRGEGAWLWDESGRRILDAISGLAVCGLGHAHPEVARAIADQAATLIHTGNLVRVPWQEQLAGRLSAITGLERAFFGNSGAEAVECALKITRALGHERGVKHPGVVVMDNSFHGRTMAALSATGSRKAQAGFEPLVSGFIRAPFGDAAAVAEIAQRSREIIAVLVEPIQGESGIRMPPAGYLAELRAICDRQGWLLIFDEIQSGLCRSGKWFAHQYEDVAPDMLVSAKALANGLPIGACLASGEAARVLTPGRHGSTFGGNPLVSRTACTVLDIMQNENLAERAAETGAYIMQGLRERLAASDRVKEIRGRGLMLGIELADDANHLKQLALERGLLINVTKDRVIRLLPPLIIDREQADMIIDGVAGLVVEG